MKRKVSAIILGISLLLSLAACGGGQCIPGDSPPNQIVETSTPASVKTSPRTSSEVGELFEEIYAQESGTYSFYIYRFVLNDSLYVVRPNGGGICPLIEDDGFKTGGVPYKSTDFEGDLIKYQQNN